MTDRPADSRAQAHAPRSLVGPGPPCAERSGGRSADGPTAALSGGSLGVSGPAVTAPGRTGRSRPPAAGCAGVAAAASKRAHLHGLRTRADVGANELAAAPVAAGTETGQVRSVLVWSEEANRSDCFPKVGTVSRSDLQEPVPPRRRQRPIPPSRLSPRRATSAPKPSPSRNTSARFRPARRSRPQSRNHGRRTGVHHTVAPAKTTPATGHAATLRGLAHPSVKRALDHRCFPHTLIRFTLLSHRPIAADTVSPGGAGRPADVPLVTGV